MNKPKLKILKLRKHSEGMTEVEEDKLLKKEGCRRLTPDEFLLNYTKELYDYVPCRVQIPNGPVVRGDYYFGYVDRRGVVVGDGIRPSVRLGSIGVRIRKKKEEKK